jgi:hypothetical protein
MPHSRSSKYWSGGRAGLFSCQNRFGVLEVLDLTDFEVYCTSCESLPRVRCVSGSPTRARA